MPPVPTTPGPSPGQGPDPALVARLARLGVQLGAAGIVAPARPVVDVGGGDTGRGAGARVGGDTADPSPAILPIEVAVPGREHAGDHGACWVSTLRRAADEPHGGEALGAIHGVDAGALAELAGDPRLAGIDLANAAFLDTETTGLMGGTGTYAFLIGIGRFQDGVFQLRQFFMRHPAEERAQLEAVAEWLDGASGLVTFNGRTFDVPLLRTRFRLHRRAAPDPLAAAPHLDLLPIARRLWRRRLASCALQSLERHILDLEREDDVPGWLVPERYFRYQSDGDARPLVGVFHHNALDILTMVSLSARVSRAWTHPDHAVAHGVDWLSLARAAETAGAAERARAAYEAALLRAMPDDLRVEATQRLADLCKRAGEWERALALWEGLASTSTRLFPYEEQAKYWEHRASPPDLARALALTEEAAARLADGRLRPRRGRGRAAVDVARRGERLRRRVGGNAMDGKGRRRAKGSADNG